jgi:hypothetical protein
MRERGEFEMAAISGWLTHEGKVNIQAALVVYEGGIADTV